VFAEPHGARGTVFRKNRYSLKDQEVKVGRPAALLHGAIDCQTDGFDVVVQGLGVRVEARM